MTATATTQARWEDAILDYMEEHGCTYAEAEEELLDIAYWTAHGIY